MIRLLTLLAVSSLMSADPPPAGQWNRYETTSFEVLATQDDDGRQLREQIEQIRHWSLARWGIKPSPFGVRCKVVVAGSKAEFSRLFPGHDSPLYRVTRSDNRVTATAIWAYAAPRWQVADLPPLVTEVALAEFESHHRVTIPLWAHRGMARMNANLPAIRATLAGLADDLAAGQKVFYSADLFSLTADRLDQYPSAERVRFERQAAAVCLYLRKELGEKKFIQVLEAGMKDPAGVPAALGMSDFEAVDKAVLAYTQTLARDVKAGKAPDDYLTWRRN
jgi:hypothetical protein